MSPHVTIRYAVVGLGHIAQVAVLPAFADAARNSMLAALVSGDRDRRMALAARYGVGATYGYEEYERCLETVDAVYLALPNAFHAEYAVRAARAGVHVLCEKPLAVTSSDGTQMIDACRDAGVQLMVAYRLHFDETTRRVLDLVREGQIGDPRYFEAAFSFIVRPDNVRTGRTGRPSEGGGTLLDVGVYCVNTARRVFGSEPTEVVALAVHSERFGADELTSGVMRFNEGRLATFTTGFSATGLGAYRIVGTTGHVRVEPAFSYTGELVAEINRNGTIERETRAAGPQFAAELLHFSDCILNRLPPRSSGTDGLQDIRIVEALLASAATGRVVAISAH